MGYCTTVALSTKYGELGNILFGDVKARFHAKHLEPTIKNNCTAPLYEKNKEIGLFLLPIHFSAWDYWYLNNRTLVNYPIRSLRPLFINPFHLCCKYRHFYSDSCQMIEFLT